MFILSKATGFPEMPSVFPPEGVLAWMDQVEAHAAAKYPASLQQIRETTSEMKDTAIVLKTMVTGRSATDISTNTHSINRLEDNLQEQMFSLGLILSELERASDSNNDQAGTEELKKPSSVDWQNDLIVDGESGFFPRRAESVKAFCEAMFKLSSESKDEWNLSWFDIYEEAENLSLESFSKDQKRKAKQCVRNKVHAINEYLAKKGWMPIFHWDAGTIKRLY